MNAIQNPPLRASASPRIGVTDAQYAALCILAAAPGGIVSARVLKETVRRGMERRGWIQSGAVSWGRRSFKDKDGFYAYAVVLTRRGDDAFLAEHRRREARPRRGP